MPYFAEVNPTTKMVERVIVADSLAWCVDNLGGEWAETADPYAENGDPRKYCGPGYGFDPAVREQFAMPWDETAATVPNTEGNYAYEEIGQVVFHNGKIWRNTIGTGTPNVWEPGISGWREYTMGTSYPVWLQPTGAHDAYLVGERVEHAGTEWENTIPANVWAPGVTGWTDLTPPVGPQPWVQPTGAQDAYPLNAEVTHNGQNWRNTGSAANVWEPGVFGWVVV